MNKFPLPHLKNSRTNILHSYYISLTDGYTQGLLGFHRDTGIHRCGKLFHINLVHVSSCHRNVVTTSHSVIDTLHTQIPRNYRECVPMHSLFTISTVKVLHNPLLHSLCTSLFHSFLLTKCTTCMYKVMLENSTAFSCV